LRRPGARSPDKTLIINLMKVVLHICCGVCAAGAADMMLSEGLRVTGYFYNPNIYPRDEYGRRLDAARLVAQKLGFEMDEGPYDTAAWQLATAGLENEHEGGLRCTACFRLRLQMTLNRALESGADAFTSTLTIGPRKSAAEINRIGEEIGGENYLCRDFKKKDGFKRAMQTAGDWGLYRQNYCGCIYSMKETHR
jgi:predicted adenine nucleotide alpha hydrolase (AANH) superfamily ATPase